MTAPITEEQLAELERLEREATPGPWLVEDKRGWWRVRGPGGVAFDDGSACNEYNAECDADTRDLIVAARNALPQLLAEVRRLRAVVDACARAGCPTAATASSPASSPPPRSTD